MKIKFERFMRILARFIIVFIIDFLTLRKLIESYEMKVSVRVFCAGILFLIIWLASIWIKEDDNTNKPSSPLKLIGSCVLIICILIGIFYTLKLQNTGNSKIEAVATYIGYKLPWLVGVTDLESRTRLLEESIKLSPNNVELNVEYAYKLLEQKRFDEARQYSARIIENLDSTNADGYAIRGICNTEDPPDPDNKDFYNQVAYKDLKESIRLGNTEIYTFLCYGYLCLYHTKDYNEAEQYLEKAISEIEHNGPFKSTNPVICAQSYYFYSIARYETVGQQSDDKQEKALENAIKIRKFPTYYLLLGRRYASHDTPEYYSKALECFNTAIQLEPGVITHVWRGWLYDMKLQMPNEAKSDYQYVIDYYVQKELLDDEIIEYVRNAMGKYK